MEKELPQVRYLPKLFTSSGKRMIIQTIFTAKTKHRCLQVTNKLNISKHKQVNKISNTSNKVNYEEQHSPIGTQLYVSTFQIKQPCSTTNFKASEAYPNDPIELLKLQKKQTP